MNQPMESRIIREHRCTGCVVLIDATGETEARVRAAKSKGSDFYTWEAHEVSPGKWSCFVCEHTACFALND